jgi:hypothetical protein
MNLRRVHTEFSDFRIVEAGFKVSKMGSLPITVYSRAPVLDKQAANSHRHVVR